MMNLLSQIQSRIWIVSHFTSEFNHFEVFISIPSKRKGGKLWNLMVQKSENKE